MSDDDVERLLNAMIADRLRTATQRAKLILEGSRGGMCALTVSQFHAYTAALRTLDALEKELTQ